MSSAIVLPSNDEWVQQHIQALFQSTTQEEFDTAFDNFFTKSATSFTLNGAKLSRDEYKKKIQDDHLGGLAKASVDVQFKGTVDSPPSISQIATVTPYLAQAHSSHTKIIYFATERFVHRRVLQRYFLREG